MLFRSDKIIITDHFYIVEGKRKCFACKHENTVIGFGIKNFIVINKQSNYYQSYHDDIHIICEPVITDKNFLTYLKNKYNYYLSKSIVVQNSYYANHCKNCSVIQSNFHLFEEVASPFFLESENDAKEFILYKINFKDDIFFNVENSLNFDYNDWLIKKYSQINDCIDFQIKTEKQTQ